MDQTHTQTEPEPAAIGEILTPRTPAAIGDQAPAATTAQAPRGAASRVGALRISPDSAVDLSAIERATLQPSTKKKYEREIKRMTESGINPMDYEALQVYAAGLKSSRKQFLLSALRIVTLDHEQRIKSNATPQNIQSTQAALYRLEAMRSVATVTRTKGTKTHTWLSQKQVTDITALCDDSLEGWRDWVILALLLGAGLRREELAQVTFDDLKQVPGKRGKIRTVLQVRGKGDKHREVPLSEKISKRLQEWRTMTGPGKIARSLGMKKQLGESMSAVAIFAIVQKYGALIGLPELAPHDLRRTFAQLGYEAGIPLTQVSTLLGHADISTTQKYLNLNTNYETTASDFIPISGD